MYNEQELVLPVAEEKYQETESKKRQLIIKLQSLYEGGKMFPTIDAVKNARDPALLWGNWLVRDSVISESGEGGISKTTFNFGMILSLQDTGKFLGIEGRQDIKVLYLDLESEDSLIKARLNLLGDKFKSRPNFRYCNLPEVAFTDLAPFIDKLIKDNKFKPDATFIDPQSIAFPMKDENSNSEATPIMRKLQAYAREKWHTAIVLVHHTAKTATWGVGHPRGAGAFANLAHVTWNFCSLGKEYSQDLFYLHIPKNRWIQDGFLNCIEKREGNFLPVEFPKGFEGGKIISGGIKGYKLQERVINSMEKGQSIEGKEIMKRLEIDPESNEKVTFYRAITSLIQRGCVTKVGWGVYCKIKGLE